MRNVFPKTPDSFHERVTDTLNILKIKERKPMKKFTPIKAVVVATATILALTLGVGAATGWNYTNLFSSIFGNTDIGIPHTINPDVTVLKNELKDVNLNVLGVAGDDKTLVLIVEFTGKNKPNFGYAGIGEYSMRLTGFTGKPKGAGWGYSMSHEVISQTDESEVVAFIYSFGGNTFGLENGTASFSWSKLGSHNYDDAYVFDVAIDYDFSAKRSFDVDKTVSLGDTSRFIKSVEVTPIAVRFKTDTDSFNDLFMKDIIKINLKNGDVIDSKNSFMGLSGGSNSEIDFIEHIMLFNTAYDLSDVYSVEIGDLVLVF